MIDLVLRMMVLCGGLVALGAVATWPLYRGDIQAWRRSSLFVKTLWWLPIFALFTLFVVVPLAAKWLILAVPAGLAVAEAVHQWRPGRRRLVALYVALFEFGWAQFGLLWWWLPPRLALEVVVTVAFASALSDVFAFFGGRYVGRHRLPASLNNRKSWEGVGGQLVGAAVGALLVSGCLGIGVGWWWWLVIGIGTAAGDLTNSFVKRRLDIKDWGTTIPGHGGILDRFSSMTGALVLTVWLMLAFGSVLQ